MARPSPSPPPGSGPPPQGGDANEVVLGPHFLAGPLDFREMFGRKAGESRPVELEIGCGKGKFLVQAAARWPDHDFLAIELVAALIRKVRSKAQRAGLSNVRLLRSNAKETLDKQVPAGSLRRVHVYFPDPWPKRRHAKHRFFADPMPDAIARALEPGGELLLATDHDPYFRELVARLAHHPDFVRVLPDVFADIPRGGFDAIFEEAGVPVFRGCWQRRIAVPAMPPSADRIP